MREVKVGQVWKWHKYSPLGLSFVVTNISDGLASTRYVDGGEWAGEYPLEDWDNDTVLIKDTEEPEEEVQEEPTQTLTVEIDKLYRAAEWRGSVDAHELSQIIQLANELA